MIVSVIPEVHCAELEEGQVWAQDHSADLQEHCHGKEDLGAGQQGLSGRRHNEPITKSSYNTTTKKDLKLKPFKILRLQKVYCFAGHPVLDGQIK